MSEKILTLAEIKLIESEAMNPIYQIAIHFGKSHTSIIRVSPLKGLILIKGNEDTGLTHILQRHDYYQSQTYWLETVTEENRTIKLENPSKFSAESIPAVNYIEIAENIYSIENLKPEDNKNPDLFDVYSGEYLHKHEIVMKYRLVTYKNTRIIHTLFPLKRTFTRDKILNLSRGSLSGEEDIIEARINISIPYQDHKGELVCRLIFSINKQTQIEDVFVEHFIEINKSDIYKIATRKMENLVEVPRYMTYLEFNDLKEFEKIIKKIISKYYSQTHNREYIKITDLQSI